MYDLTAHIFWKGKPSDYISLSTGYDYKVCYDQELKLLNSYFAQILPNNDNRNNVLKSISKSLCGNRQNNKLTILYGSGCCGRSTFMNLVQETLGDYCKILPWTNLCDCDTIYSWLDFSGVRIVFFVDEFHVDDSIDEAMLTKLLNDSVIISQKIYSKPKKTKLQFRPFMVCDKIPQYDKSLVNITKWDTKFVDKPTQIKMLKKGWIIQ